MIATIYIPVIPCDLWTLLRDDVQTVYKCGYGKVVSRDVRTLTHVVASVIAHEGEGSLASVLESATAQLGPDLYVAAVNTLLGIPDDVRYANVGQRVEAAAKLLAPRYKDGEALRKSERNKRPHIAVILDQIADRLVERAIALGFSGAASDVLRPERMHQLPDILRQMTGGGTFTAVTDRDPASN